MAVGLHLSPILLNIRFRSNSQIELTIMGNTQVAIHQFIYKKVQHLVSIVHVLGGKKFLRQSINLNSSPFHTAFIFRPWKVIV